MDDGFITDYEQFHNYKQWNAHECTKNEKFLPIIHKEKITDNNSKSWEQIADKPAQSRRDGSVLKVFFFGRNRRIHLLTESYQYHQTMFQGY